MNERFVERPEARQELAGDLLRAKIHDTLLKAAQASKERGGNPRRGIAFRAISTVRGFDTDPKRRAAFSAVEDSLSNPAEDDESFLAVIEEAMISFFNTFTKEAMKEEIPKVFWHEKPPKFLQDFLNS
jgi:hypothetical protein